ncbi:hypothetical protein AURDEDRAFT_178324 [Auricularia subglabra TFB-10046 SS5]|uniref:Uncharacterized protein n=1 Tax=Auricularia subglabra (strain TFB-10046 / SS5) TaxID=717982 RepID=J0CQT7_AURST|nr:hypothetical protein AURDEDRAFT_178324 [Auricularia subglabra TFB-10046 SS5]
MSNIIALIYQKIQDISAMFVTTQDQLRRTELRMDEQTASLNAKIRALEASKATGHGQSSNAPTTAPPGPAPAPAPAASSSLSTNQTPQPAHGPDVQPDDWTTRKRGARGDDTNQFKKNIRDIVNPYLGFTKSPTGKLVRTFPPSPDLSAPLPSTLDGGSFVWEGNIRSHAYNHRIVSLLSARYVALHQGPVQPNQSNQSNQPGRTVKALEEAFFGYLGYLKTERAELLAAKPPSVKQAKALHDSANGRRLQRSDARVAFIFDERLMQFFKIRTQNNQTRPATKQDIEFLFSTDCTSSDELDRSLMPAKVYRLIDQCLHLNSVGRAGSSPRNRVPGHETSWTTPRDLPENWIDSTYLGRLDEAEVFALRLRAKVEVDWPALIRAMHAIRAKFQDEADHRLNPQP